jgi:hypothetical protein
MDSKIISSCSFIQFAKSLSEMNYSQFVNKETGEVFIKLSCVKKDGTPVEVTSSSKMKAPTLQELYAQAKDLAVYTLESGSHKLGKTNLGEAVDLAKLIG